MDKEDNKEIIIEIRNKIQFCTTIAVFFSGVVYYFFNIFDKNNADKIALQFASIVIIYLLTYVFFDLFKYKISKKSLKIINDLILIGILMFIFPIAHLVSIKNELTFISFISLKISLYGLIVIPVLLLIIILLSSIFYSTKKIRKIP